MKTYLYEVSYLSNKNLAEIDAGSKELAERKMERLANLGCEPASKYRYIGIKQDEPAPFFFPDFRAMDKKGNFTKSRVANCIIK